MSIFDFLTEKDNIEEAIVTKDTSLLLKIGIGQLVYKVSRGEVLLYWFKGKAWTLERDGEMVTYYQITNNKNLHDSFSEKLLGISYFTDIDDALKVANAYIDAHKDDILMISPNDIVRTTAFFYIRKCDSRKMVAFISELKNGLLYMKDFYSFYHIKDMKFDKALKQLTSSFKLTDVDDESMVREIDGFVPEIKTMYRCKEDKDWKYAEAGYGGCKEY
jgi:hypothetical protein